MVTKQQAHNILNHLCGKAKLRQMMVTWFANYNMYSHPSVKSRIKGIKSTIK